jgi:hypothetical protein
MAEVIGIVGSIISILNLSSTIVKYVHSIKDGASDRAQLLKEIINTRGYLHSLRDHIEMSNPDDPWTNAVQGLNKPGGPLELYKISLERVAKKLNLGASQDASSGRAFVRALYWPFQAGEVASILSILERQKAFFVLALQMDHISLSREILKNGDESRSLFRAMTMDFKDVRSNVKEMIQRSRDEAEIKILDWLSPLQPQKKHIDVRSRRLKGTGDWFLRLPAFRNWINSSGDSNVLCCKGIPGAGKTVIASLVIDHINEVPSTTPIAMAYMYCDYRDRDSKMGQIARNLVGSILKQIVNTRQVVPEAIKDLYLTEKTAGNVATAADFAKILVDLCEERSTFLVVDALDECDYGTHRDSFLETLKVLEQSQARIFLTTRPHQKDIERHMRPFPQIVIEASDEDIRTLLSFKIEKRIEEDEDMEELIDRPLQDEIVTTLVNGAQGM